MKLQSRITISQESEKKLGCILKYAVGICVGKDTLLCLPNPCHSRTHEHREFNNPPSLERLLIHFHVAVLRKIDKVLCFDFKS